MGLVRSLIRIEKALPLNPTSNYQHLARTILQLVNYCITTPKSLRPTRLGRQPREPMATDHPPSVRGVAFITLICSCFNGRDISDRYYGCAHSTADSLFGFTRNRDKALELLTGHLHHELESTSLAQGPANSMLATVKVLCYNELKWPSSGFGRFISKLREQ
jgi:hypothetical protein